MSLTTHAPRSRVAKPSLLVACLLAVGAAVTAYRLLAFGHVSWSTLPQALFLVAVVVAALAAGMSYRSYPGNPLAGAGLHYILYTLGLAACAVGAVLLVLALTRFHLPPMTEAWVKAEALVAGVVLLSGAMCCIESIRKLPPS